ncbi:MAG TPA: thiamine phosphate synthase [Myxococcales bacterium]|nr:thiamine phosphate synthase [Myxococcales bacterium]
MIRLYLITPPSGDPAPSVEAALAVLPRGSVGVQLRQPGRSAQDLLALARSLRAICTKAGAPLLINDRADVALAAGADGVHLPANGLPVSGARSLGLPLVGVSAHSPEEVARAARDGADFAVYAPVYETPGKTPRGEAALAEACRAAPIPVLALGGVNETNAHRCIDAGARGVACIRSVLGASDPAAAAIRLWQAITLALLLCASSASADDARYQDYPIGTRAMALGGAFVALSDDPSGLYYNPAGICDTRRLNVSVSASLYGLERQSTTGKISIGPGTFSIAGLAELNVIPGEAGMIKGAGKLDERGASWAYGFDVSVPSFRSSRTDASDPFEVHTRITDRTFTVAAGAAARFNEKLNLGFSVQYVLRLYETSEDALNVQGDPVNPAVGVYHANASFQNGNLVTVVGAKYRLSDEWLLGASIGLPGAPLHSGGSVTVQDVVSVPGSPAQVIVKNSGVDSQTSVPAMARIGAAWTRPQQWTVSGQLVGHLGASYDRFNVPPDIAQRLRLQDHIERKPVLDLNLGGEYLFSPSYALALGFFTSHSAAPGFQLNPDGTLASGSSREPHVNLYGGTLTLGMYGEHSLSHLGVSVSYGSGETAVPLDPTGIVDPTGYRAASVQQLFLYVFLASTFRY